MKTRFLALALLALGLSSLHQPSLAQEDNEPDRLRRESRELMQKARALKDEGNIDESTELARRAKELAGRADEMQRRSQERAAQPAPSRRDPDRNVGPEPERGGEIRRPEARNRDQVPRAPGEERRMRRVDPSGQEGRTGPRPRGGDELDRLGPATREREREGLAREERLERREAERMELALRRFHVRQAIKHLHAAGLHEQADRLEERLEFAARRFRERPEFRRDEDSRRDRPEHSRDAGGPRERSGSSDRPLR